MEMGTVPNQGKSENEINQSLIMSELFEAANDNDLDGENDDNDEDELIMDEDPFLKIANSTLASDIQKLMSKDNTKATTSTNEKSVDLKKEDG